MKKKIGDFTLREIKKTCMDIGPNCTGCAFVTNLGICMASTAYNNFHDVDIEIEAQDAK